ncbi:MAG: ABC transporter substrate-binding protein, partial [Xanthobacteraceae bacterium]|nr:ABC transporter substrate-binding protein [Xanthobacteraceae bacterium]
MARAGIILSALAGAAMIASAATCPPAAAEDGVIRIGMTLRMIVENGIKYGQLTRDELLGLNANGGFNGHKVEVILLDDECNAQKGVANANRFIEQDKVHLIIGSICSSVTLPLVDITARAQVPQISPTSTARPITEKGSAWIFRVAASERYFAAVHAKYMAENVGKKVAYIYTTDAAGISFVTAYQQFMKDTYGVEPLFSAQQQETDVDFRSNLLKIKSLQPEVLA